MAARRKKSDQGSGLVFSLGGVDLVVDVQSFTIPDSALMGSVLKRLQRDAAAVTGVEAELKPDHFVAAAAFVVARRAEPTLTLDDWFSRFTMSELSEAIRGAAVTDGDSPEA